MIYKRVKQFTIENNLLDAKNIGIGVSGGPDSMFLMHILKTFKKEFKLNLMALHFNHKIRPESDIDELFVKKAASSLNIDFYSESSDVPSFAKLKNLSLENAARIKRYDFFERAVSQFNLSSIAIAHTKNDAAETFLMNLLRGSGLDGLSSMKVKRNFYIRPLLFLTKEKILKFLNDNNIQFLIDRTNADQSFLRNKIRLSLMDNLKMYNNNIVNTLYKENKLLNEDCKFIDDTAGKNFLYAVSFINNSAVIDISRLSSYYAVRSRVLSKSIKKIVNSFYSLSYNNINRIVDLSFKKKGKVFLRGILRAYIKNNNLIIEKI